MQIRRLPTSDFQTKAFSEIRNEPARASSQFTRAGIDSAVTRKTAPRVNQNSEPFSKRFMQAADQIKAAVSARLAPGQSMPICVNGELKILHRPESRNAIVLQNPKDVLSARRNAFCLATDPTGKVMMAVDDWLVMSKKSSRYPEACKQLAGLQEALGIPFNKK